MKALAGSKEVVFIPGQSRFVSAARPFRGPRELIFVSVPVYVEGVSYRKVVFPRAVLRLFNSEEPRGTLVLTEAGDPVSDPALVKAVCKATTVYWEHNREGLAENTRLTGPRYDALVQALERLRRGASSWWSQDRFDSLLAECRRHTWLKAQGASYSRELLALLLPMDRQRRLDYRTLMRIDRLSRAAAYTIDVSNASFFRAEPLATEALARLRGMDPRQRAGLPADDLADLVRYAEFVLDLCIAKRHEYAGFGVIGAYNLWDQHIRERTQIGFSTYRLPLPVTDYDAIPDLLDHQAVAPDVPEVPRAWIFDPTHPPPAEAVPELPPWSPPAEPATGTVHPAVVGDPSTGTEASRSGPGEPAAVGRSESPAEPEDSRHLAWMYLALSVLPLLVMVITRRWHWSSALMILFALGMAWEYYTGKRR